MMTTRGRIDMATPILATPVLRGKDAERFWQNAERNQTRKPTKKERADAARGAAVFISFIKNQKKNVLF